MKKYSIIRGVRNHGSEIEKWDEFTGDRREDAMRGDLWIAREEGCEQISGYIATSGCFFFNRLFIARICVHPDKRLQGVAQTLFAAVLLQYQGMQIWTSTEEGNAGALRLFDRNGFVQAGALGGLNRDGSKEHFYYLPALAAAST